jgi:hypothetical protein
MPREKVSTFIRIELDDNSVDKLSRLDIAKIQTAFNVSYGMVLTRLKALGILDDILIHKLKLEKREKNNVKVTKCY